MADGLCKKYDFLYILNSLKVSRKCTYMNLLLSHFSFWHLFAALFMTALEVAKCVMKKYNKENVVDHG